MADIIIGLFQDRPAADEAIEDLNDAGFEAKDITVVAKKDKHVVQEDATGSITNGAISGVTAGGVIGGVAGLLVGVGILAIPGGILIGGPLATALGLTGAAATTLSGAATGVVAGGLIGALVGLGLPQEEAEYYEQGVSEGGIVIAVPVDDDNNIKARQILEDNGADRVRSFSLHGSTHKHTAV